MSRPDLHQQIRQLCLNTTHHQVIDHDDNGTQIHTTESPSLLDQLETASNTADGTNGAGGYKSRPAAWLEPLDTLRLIDQEASAWVRKLGDDDPPTVKECVSRVHGLWAMQDDDTKKRIDEVKAGLKDGSFKIWKGPIVDNTGKEVLAKDAVADDKFLGGIAFYVKGVEGKVPGGDKK